MEWDRLDEFQLAYVVVVGVSGSKTRGNYFRREHADVLGIKLNEALQTWIIEHNTFIGEIPEEKKMFSVEDSGGIQHLINPKNIERAFLVFRYDSVDDE